MTTTTVYPISTGQFDLLAKLATESHRAKVYIDTQLAANHVSHPMELSFREAKNIIGVAINEAREDRASTPQPQAAPGYYTSGEDFVVVVANRARTRTYAKRLTQTGSRWSWEYAPGVGRTLAGLEPMSLDQARKFGHLHGVCIKCCKPLTDPKSVEAGIGPVCAKAFR